MRNILILGRDHHPHGKETSTEIYEGLLPLTDPEYALKLAYWPDLLFDIVTDGTKIGVHGGQDLSAYSCLLMTNWFSHASIRKDIAHSIALYCDYSGIPCFNSEALYSRSTSKLSQMMLAAMSGITVPRTLFSLSYERLCDAVRSAEGLRTPFIIKDAQASRGRGNYLIRSFEELPQYEPEHSESHPFMAQELVEGPGGDYRLFVVSGRVELIIKRLPVKGLHMANTSQGAKTELVARSDFPPDAITAAERMSALLHREVTGIDLIFDNQQKPYFLEANPIPQIATGSNVSYKLKALAAALQKAADNKGDIR